MTPKMLLFKQLDIKPSGIITGGKVQYNADDKSGIISYTGEIDVHLLFFSKAFPLQGTATVDPSLLVSANMAPGKKLLIGGIDIEVVSVADGKANCNVTVVAENVTAHGVAVFDVSQPDISLLSLKANGLVLGYNVTLEAEA